MKQIRKLAALILVLSVLFSLAVPTLAASSVQTEMQGSAAYMVSAVKAPEVSSIGGEWAVLGLARSGYSVPKELLCKRRKVCKKLQRRIARAQIH